MMEGEYTPQSLCLFSPERPRKSPVVRATGERVGAQAQYIEHLMCLSS
jgi:hypothetical protein